MTPKEAYDKTKELGKRIPELELVILKDACYSLLYAIHVIEGKWELGEPTISKNAYYSYRYAIEVIEDRFVLGEPTIIKNAFSSFYYAKEVIKGRWELGEPAISKNAYYSYHYALDVIKGRLPDFMHNALLLSNNEFAKEYVVYIK